MQQTSAFIGSSFLDYVCHLHQSLYGLKQVPWTWFVQLRSFLQMLWFQGSTAKSTLFILRSSTYVVYLLIYVDDIVLQILPMRYNMFASFYISPLPLIGLLLSEFCDI